MSDRFRTFLDLDVRAPLLVVPIELGDPASDEQVIGRESIGGNHTEEGTEKEAYRGEEAEEGQEWRRQQQREDDLSAPARGRRRRRRDRKFASAHSTRPSRRRELLVVDLGSVSVTTARLAHLRRNSEQRQQQLTGGREGKTLSFSGDRGSSENGERPPSNDRLEQNRSRAQSRAHNYSEGIVGDGGGRRRSDSVSSDITSISRRRSRTSSSVGPTGEATGKRWHFNFYDVFNIDVGQVGVLLKRDGYSNGSDGGVDGRRREEGDSIEDETDSGMTSGVPGLAVGAGAGRRAAVGVWLVDPFDIKVKAGIEIATMGRLVELTTRTNVRCLAQVCFVPITDT